MYSIFLICLFSIDQIAVIGDQNYYNIPRLITFEIKKDAAQLLGNKKLVYQY
jgi:hypothetical protein